MSSRLLRIRNGKRGKKIRRVCYDKSQGKIVLWRRDQLQLEDEERQMSTELRDMKVTVALIRVVSVE